MTVAASDVIIVGAGPVGLFAAFQLGLFDMRCRLIDSLDRPGGQCTEFYADKPIYDVPGLPSILAQELVERLMQQIAPFKPEFSLNTFARSLERRPGGGFRVACDGNAAFEADIVVIAGGGGAFLRTKATPTADHTIADLAVANDGASNWTWSPDAFASWDVGLYDGTIPVDTEKFETSQPGVFAIGDVACYPGKLRLLLSGFHEAALMTQAARKIVNPGRRMPARPSNRRRSQARNPS